MVKRPDLPFDGPVTFGYGEAPVHTVNVMTLNAEIGEPTHRCHELSTRPGPDWRPGRLRRVPGGIYRWPGWYTRTLATRRKLHQRC